VRCRPLVHELLSRLHRRTPTPSFKLRQLARVVGLPT
jgi:hypothetical protein